MGYACVCGRIFDTERGMKIHRTKMACEYGEPGAYLIREMSKPYSCVCGKRFDTERGMKIHRTKMGCLYASSYSPQVKLEVPQEDRDRSLVILESHESQTEARRSSNRMYENLKTSQHLADADVPSTRDKYQSPRETSKSVASCVTKEKIGQGKKKQGLENVSDTSCVNDFMSKLSVLEKRDREKVNQITENVAVTSRVKDLMSHESQTEARRSSNRMNENLKTSQHLADADLPSTRDKDQSPRETSKSVASCVTKEKIGQEKVNQITEKVSVTSCVKDLMSKLSVLEKKDREKDKQIMDIASLAPCINNLVSRLSVLEKRDQERDKQVMELASLPSYVEDLMSKFSVLEKRDQEKDKQIMDIASLAPCINNLMSRLSVLEKRDQERDKQVMDSASLASYVENLMSKVSVLENRDQERDKQNMDIASLVQCVNNLMYQFSVLEKRDDKNNKEIFDLKEENLTLHQEIRALKLKQTKNDKEMEGTRWKMQDMDDLSSRIDGLQKEMKDLHWKCLESKITSLMRDLLSKEILVRNTGGDRARQDTKPSCTIAKVKSEVERERSVSPSKQVLPVGQTKLTDNGNVVNQSKIKKSSWQITVESLTSSHRVTMDVDVKTTVEEIIPRIHYKIQIPLDEHGALLFNFNKLEQSKLLVEYGIRQDSILNLMTKPRKSEKENKMTIFANCSDKVISDQPGDNIVGLEVCPSTTVYGIKSMIHLKTEVPPSFQTLKFMGSCLHDNQNVGRCKISDLSTIDVFYQDTPRYSRSEVKTKVFMSWNKTHPLEEVLDWSNTVWDLKCLVEDKLGLNTNSQEMALKGVRSLEDSSNSDNFQVYPGVRIDNHASMSSLLVHGHAKEFDEENVCLVFVLF